MTAEMKSEMPNVEFGLHITRLMLDPNFLASMATICNDAYNLYEGNMATPLFTKEELELIQTKSPLITEKTQQKLASNLAGFRATLVAVEIAGEIFGKPYIDVLENLASNKPDIAVLKIAQYAANATWATGAGFRGRLYDDSMMFYDQLSDEEKYKDTVQVKTAAKYLHYKLTSGK